MSDDQSVEFSEEELLHRQVRAQYVQEGQVSSLAFSAFPKDKGELSVDRGAFADARASYEHAIAEGMDSVGVWSVRVDEVRSLETSVKHTPQERNWAHSSIMLDAFGVNRRKRIARRLRDFAEQRGASYRP